MKDYLTEINEHFPIRKKAEEKSKFYDYVRSELGEGRVKRERLENKHENIIIGDISEAKVVFTAHYDTPATSLIPNMMFPANKILGMIIHMVYPVAMALLSLFAAYIVGDALGMGQSGIVILYLLLYFGVFYCSTRLITNKHNKNDNTSGVATVMSIASAINDGRVAFVLFDNEEKGLLGSKALNKKYKKLFDNKMVVNFDCVGNGDQMIFIAKEKAEKLPEYELLRSVITSDDSFEIHHLPFKKSLGNSDHKSFDCGIGVVASRRSRFVKFYTGRIHTERDTVANSENIYFLAEKMKHFIEKL